MRRGKRRYGRRTRRRSRRGRPSTGARRSCRSWLSASGCGTKPRTWRPPALPDAPDIRGVCPPRFAAVREAFAANFAEGKELGARFCLALEGEIVVDLMGGFADRAQTLPFAEETLTPIFSTTKALAAFMIARLVDAQRLDYAQPVADVWPEFAAAGKGAAPVGQ